MNKTSDQLTIPKIFEQKLGINQLKNIIGTYPLTPKIEEDGLRIYPNQLGYFDPEFKKWPLENLTSRVTAFSFEDENKKSLEETHGLSLDDLVDEAAYLEMARSIFIKVRDKILELGQDRKIILDPMPVQDIPDFIIRQAIINQSDMLLVSPFMSQFLFGSSFFRSHEESTYSSSLSLAGNVAGISVFMNYEPLDKDQIIMGKITKSNRPGIHLIYDSILLDKKINEQGQFEYRTKLDVELIGDQKPKGFGTIQINPDLYKNAQD